MNEQKDIGILMTLLDRLEKERLPRAISIRERVFAGEKLGDTDIEFLERVLADARSMGP